MKNTIPLKAFFSFFLFPSFCLSQISSDTPPFVRDSIDQYVNRALKDWKIPGIAVCIVKDGRVVVMKGYGVTKLNGREEIDENTLFNIGSNTKAFTATILTMLDEEKILSLDDKAVKWLPEFKLKDPWLTNAVTVRDLLCHRLGFKNDQGEFIFWDTDLSSRDVLEKFATLTPPYGFRAKWGYTNPAFLAAGLIAGNATHSSWENLIRTRIFQPLGMTRSLALSKDKIQATNIATGHTLDNDQVIPIPFINMDNMAPAGAISSSVHDLSRWVKMQLDTGKFEGRQIIPSQAIEETWIPNSILGYGRLILNSGSPQCSMYGLGFVIQEYNCKKIVSHNGGVNGFVSSIMLVPEEKLGIIVLTNTDANAFYEVFKWQILDAYFGMPYKNYSKLFADFNESQKRPEKIKFKMQQDTVAMHLPASLPLEAFQGTYLNEPYGFLKIEKEGEHLKIIFQHHEMTGKLESLGGNRFFCTYSNPVWGVADISFSVENKKVVSASIRIGGMVGDEDTYEFVKRK